MNRIRRCTPLILMVVAVSVFATMGGCLDGKQQEGRDGGQSSQPSSGDHRKFLTRWPADATILEIRIDCACRGEVTRLGWDFQANWTDRGNDVDPPEQTHVRDGTDADLFATLLLRNRMNASTFPVAGTDILRGVMVAIGVPGHYTTMLGTGVAPSHEVSTFDGAGAGTALAASRQEFPLEVEMDGQPLTLVFVATNVSGNRLLPTLDVSADLPSAASVEIRTGESYAMAYDEPLLDESPGVAVDQNYPRRAHVRVFGETTVEVESVGRLAYVFFPWVRTEGTKDATYKIDAPDHSYRGQVNYTNGAGGTRCIEGCSGLGGTYSIDSGIAPAGTTRFTIEGASCVTDGGCMGAMVAVDLGGLQPELELVT